MYCINKSVIFYNKYPYFLYIGITTLTPDQLITFSVVAEHGNISHAARALHLSQPAVSGQLQALQQSFGEPLYKREGRGIRLTPAGEQLLATANRMRATMLEAVSLRKVSGALGSGTLCIGASTTPASYLLPELVAQFKQRFPGIRIRMAAGNTREIVARLNEFDIAVVEGELADQVLSRWQTIDWQQDEVVAIVPRTHPLAIEDSVVLETLANESLIMREDGSGVRNLIMRAFAQQGITLDNYLELAGVEGIKQGVRAGLGVGFVSKLSLRHEDHTINGVRINKGLMRSIRIILPNEIATSRVAQAFLKTMNRDG